MTHSKILLLALSTCLALSACQTTGYAGMRSGTLDSAAASATHTAGEDGVKPLALAEKLYNQTPTDPLAALEYARALRENKSLDKGSAILEPFANDKTASARLLTEFSAISLAKGDYPKAEVFAKKAVAKDPKSFRAYHNLGLALDAQAKQPEAEQALRKALALWQGNPTNIMNNLALNLAAQGYLDEAIDLLRRAQALSPSKTEIERNIRIVTALQQAARGPTPKPEPKPADLHS